LLVSYAPFIILILLVWFFIARSVRAGGGGPGGMLGSFGKSRHRVSSKDTISVTFDDVAGIQEAKDEVHEIIEFLKNPKRFQRLGGRIPRGVLLVGPPGCGKTLLAKAIAGEADVPFFSISGSDFVEMFVGVGASRVRDLFVQAKQHAPCIIFVDEIDAVGRHRGAGLGGSHDEREQTLNQILVEMDGFDTNTNVIVIAATNRPDILDPALLRPGRFDRQVILDRPDIQGRKAILEVHAKGKPLDSSVELTAVAKQTPGFTGADLANLLNEAAILATRRNKTSVSNDELEEAVDRLIGGPQKKSRIISPKEKEVVAYHESGHALVARILPNADPVHKISIVARGMLGGYTRLLPTEDRHLWTQAQLYDTLAVTLGGRVAEEVCFGEISTGAQHDLEQVTKIARKMVTEYGMSKNLGPRTYGRKEELVFLGKEISEQRNYGDKVANLIDDEIQVLIQQCYQVAKDILTQHLDRLEKLTRQLMESETLDREELDKLFAGLPGHTASPVTKGRVRRKASTPRSKKTVAGKLNKKPTLQPAS
ncbi:MAG: ATP-dependent zinc metalloprotease FtsH, partial [Dehalococcoidia bacterium]|nr:ATP-dependent zinc metalloprotease FtsH [Dehalococcoidia bacterium]